MAARRNGGMSNVRVRAAIGVGDEEMERRPVMPERILTLRAPREEIRHDPGDPFRPASQPPPRKLDRRGGDVEHADIGVAGREQLAGKGGRAAAYVDERGVMRAAERGCDSGERRDGPVLGPALTLIAA